MARKKASTSTKAGDTGKIVTPEFRGSFVTLFKPRAFGDNDPKYAITVVLPEGDPFWTKLQKKIDKTAKEKFGKVPHGMHNPIRRGDETKYEEWEDYKFIKCESNERPGIVDKDLEDIVDRSEVYSGAFFKASFRLYAWHYPPTNKRGVSIQLDNVMKTRDGEPYSGRSQANEDFADHVDSQGDDMSDDTGDDAGLMD